MSDAKKKWIDSMLGKMNLDQKVGQLLVFGFCGPIITPDTVQMIKKYHLGGLRISQFLRLINLTNDVKPGEEIDEITMKSMHFPKGINKDYTYVKPTTVANPTEYAEVLNKLRSMAMEYNDGIPLHFTVDMEGSGSDDLLGGQRLFPHPMGFTASGDPTLAYRAAKCIGLQARAVGANMIHSPCIDVNTNPLNPEIGTRAYGDNVQDVIKYSLQSLKGFQESGIMATAKHFPGRGESAADAHFGLPSVDLSYKDLYDNHIAPYAELIKAGLPCVMSAHSLYPALGESELPSSLSRKILTDFLRGELGFKGVITTDNMMMGGILKKYEMSDAIIEALRAGNDLILNRDESPLRLQILEKVKAAIKSGYLPEKEVDEKIQRILAMRWDMGLAENGGVVDAKKATDITNDSFIMATAKEAAEKSVLLIRDEQKVLPLKPTQRVLLVEQVFPTHSAANNMYSHPGLLWEQMCENSENVGSVEIENIPSAKDRERLERRLNDNDYDVIVCTNYYYHKVAKAIGDIVHRCIKTGKPVVVVASTPYTFASEPDFKTVLACFQLAGKENMRAVSDILFGKLNPIAKLPVKI